MLLDERLRADHLSLVNFAAANPAYLEVASRSPDLRRFEVDAHLDAPVAAGDAFRIERDHRLIIEIPDNYLSRDGAGGFVKSRIRRRGDRIFHPNVWGDGAFCFDSAFHPSKGLDQQLLSALELMQCQVVNHGSVAHWESDLAFVKKGGEIIAQITPARFTLPRGGVRLRVIAPPRLVS